MFSVKSNSISKELIFDKNGVRVEIGSIYRDDPKSQVNLVMEVLNDLDELTNAVADEMLRDELCSKYNLSKND